MVLIPGIGIERNGALRWINLAGLQFQPSEIMKIGLVVVLAMLISKNPGRIKKFWTRLSTIIVFCFTSIWVISSARPSKCYDDNCSNCSCYYFYSWC